MGQFSCIGEAIALLDVCAKTIQRCDTAKRFARFRDIGEYLQVSAQEVSRLLEWSLSSPEMPESPSTAICCRVSSHDQKMRGTSHSRSLLRTKIERWRKPGRPYKKTIKIREIICGNMRLDLEKIVQNSF
ncbi:MAG: hypothetical protein ACTSRC_00850 [Candidatus Helarchaeota archaeon]